MIETATAGPGPDAVLYAPSDELTGTELLVDELRAHPDEQRRNPSYRTRAKPRRRPRVVREPEADLYGGHEGLLIRTALIRSKDYDPRKRVRVSGATDVAQLCKHLIYADSEFLITIPLDAANRVRAIHEAGVGPANHVATSPQQLLKVTVLTGATAAIIVHNHPSGSPQPSQDDARTTYAINNAAECLGGGRIHVVPGQRLQFQRSALAARIGDAPRSSSAALAATESHLTESRRVTRYKVVTSFAPRHGCGLTRTSRRPLCSRHSACPSGLVTPFSSTSATCASVTPSASARR